VRGGSLALRLLALAPARWFPRAGSRALVHARWLLRNSDALFGSAEQMCFVALRRPNKWAKA